MNFLLLILLLPSVVLMAALTGAKNRMRLVFMGFGFLAAYLSGQLNSFFAAVGNVSEFDLSIHVAPITEEFIKAFPLTVLLFAVKLDRRSALEYAVWTGFGFAFFENAKAFATAISWVPGWSDISFALSRGFGASMVHSLCTAILIYGISVCQKQRKLLLPGSLAVFSLACMIHSTFNVLISSRYAAAPFVLTLGTYAVFAVIVRKQRKKSPKSVQNSKN